ncbi:MAG TPA: sigma-70 family RNA polymerase sigma factor [Verrucomicrobiota bacterium]|jgi:RNA polymerase sigma-70 factor (ECF subfamily)|nr:sigma-70 family RNA polymerase sigma factor [Verrucomicrobiota bacterium]HQL77228.1 sigma-70 family RNA polymerase sigma factor [Verrucomicrobiota bacterium]
MTPRAEDTATPATARREWFTTTHWTVVLNARDQGSPEAAAALEKLCRTYWYPLYACVRRQGHDEASAKDLTQEFFTRLIHKNRLDHVRREKGRFRSFLLASLKNFLSDEWDKAQAQKRGGGQTLLSLDDDSAEDRYRLEPADSLPPDKLYDQRWALTLLGQAKARLKEEYAQAGKANLYERLRVFEAGDPDGSTYAEIAAECGLTESAVNSAAHRLRQRYGELVREEVAHTVGNTAAIDEELRHLIAVLSG